MSNNHRDAIIDQFSRQAVPFAQVPGHTNEESLQLLLEMADASTQDTVLDVACGPGIVACAFAPHVNHVTCLDITPAMLEQAQSIARQMGLKNVSWQQGEGENLPFADQSFSIVLSRYAFHHCLHPEAVLAEMLRVCRPGGTVVMADVALPTSKVEAYDRLEKLRDPSHTHALSDEEFERLAHSAALQNIRLAHYKVNIELEQQMAASFPNPGDDTRIRHLIRDDIGPDHLGIHAELRGHEIHYAVPITVMAARKAG
jgi:ubiquinone/menaquinone biosynthesis C-methylase UbiE